MMNITKENNLSETAFAVKTGQGRYHLRWFTLEKKLIYVIILCLVQHLLYLTTMIKNQKQFISIH
ncbi:MAG: PhzF family phenazine biosynthesis protein [[Eubacterium] sulci]|nr:PhzF family phenazine biosynthesis protein [[Eubacterium] sulci]